MKRTNLFPKRAVHLDFHTMPGIGDIGRDFHAGRFAGTLADAGVDYITVFARCNLGFTYYPTDIGTRYPGLHRDLLGSMVSACHKRNIRVAAYLNAGLDHEHALRHREWCKVDREGRIYNLESDGCFFRRMCLNTNYRGHILAMIREILERYPVDGLFLDCINFSPCYGVECVEGMQNAGLNACNESDAEKFCRHITDSFRTEVETLVNKKKKGINLFFNGMPFRSQPTHIEIEVLPQGGWGYDFFPSVIRYVRTLEKPFFTMTGRFHSHWGDFCGLRPEHALLFDCYNSIANGGTCSIGDHMHPRGNLEKPVYDLIEKVYHRTASLDPWTEKARPLTDILVVYPDMKNFSNNESFDMSPVAGAARMLTELKCQFDVGDNESSMEGYRMVILPDTVRVDGSLQRKLQKHLSGEGTLISSAFAGLKEGNEKFALKEYNLTYEGIEKYNPSFFKADNAISAGIQDMPVNIYNSGIVMHPGKEAKVLADLWKPYFNFNTWNWSHWNMYTPPQEKIGAAVIQSGNIIHFGFSLFRGYFERAVVAHKILLGNCIKRLLPKPLVHVENMPSFGQVTVTTQTERTMVHLLTYVPELRGKQTQIIEEPIVVHNVKLHMRIDTRKISRVYLAPSVKSLPFDCRDGYTTVIVPEVTGYQMVVFEE